MTFIFGEWLLYGWEIAYDNQRFEMFERLLNGWSEVECSVAEEIAISFAEKQDCPRLPTRGLMH